MYWLFRGGTIKKIHQIGGQYGQKYGPISKHQYGDRKTDLNFSAILL